jgi:hypothetical protein
MCFSLEMSYLMGKGCICALVHTFIPCVCVTTTTEVVVVNKYKNITNIKIYKVFLDDNNNGY